MANVLDGLKYTEKHEWVKIDGETAIFGISDFAQNALGDIVFVDLPKVGKSLKQAQSFGTIESVKAAEDLYAPISGEVMEVNSEISKKPESLNSDAYSSWMVKVKNISIAETEKLMNADQYREFLKTL